MESQKNNLESDYIISFHYAIPYRCVRDVMAGFDNGSILCDECHVPCAETDFTLTVTANNWPSEVYLVSF